MAFLSAPFYFPSWGLHYIKYTFSGDYQIFYVKILLKVEVKI